MSWILRAIISFGTNTSTVPAVSNGLVGVLTTFRVPDKGNKGVWSLVCANVFSESLSCSSYPSFVSGKDFLENVFFLRIRDQKNQYRVNRRCLLHPHFRAHVQLNVCSLGWVIESNTLRSVTSVSSSFPEPANQWERPSHRYRL